VLNYSTEQPMQRGAGRGAKFRLALHHGKLLEPAMAERSPIFSAKRDSHRIGYIEGSEAFDLSGRRRCSYNEKTGNLYDPNSKKIIGHVSLEGKFVGASWIADELFPRSDGDTQILGTEGYVNSPDPVVTGGILDAANRSAGPMPPSSEQDEPAALTNSPAEPSAPDPNETFLSEDYDVERALEVIRGVLRKR
jgi:hypothetical protein